MAADIEVHFEGPFSWPGLPGAPSVFEVDAAKAAGIYLWAVPLPQGHLIYYVGETGRTFRIRLLEHYKEHASGFYHLYSPPEFARGKKVLAWPGHYDVKDKRSVQECIAQYRLLTGPVSELATTYRFFLASTTCEDRLRRRVEAAIASALYEAPEPVGTFQDAGIRYSHRREDETPLICTVTSSQPLMGMPVELQV